MCSSDLPGESAAVEERRCAPQNDKATTCFGRDLFIRSLWRRSDEAGAKVALGAVGQHGDQDRKSVV